MSKQKSSSATKPSSCEIRGVKGVGFVGGCLDLDLLRSHKEKTPLTESPKKKRKVLQLKKGKP